MTRSRTSRGPLPGMLRGVVLAGCVGSTVIATVGWMAKGEQAGWSALAGALTAFAVIVLGLVAMRLIIAGDPGVSMAGSLVVYIGQLIVLVAILLAVRDRSWLHGAAFAAAAVAQTVILQVGQVIGYSRARHEIYPEAGAR